MSVQKEVEKYQKAKQDLNNKFLARMADLRSRFITRNSMINDTINDLEDEMNNNQKEISNIDNALSEVK